MICFKSPGLTIVWHVFDSFQHLEVKGLSFYMQAVLMDGWPELFFSAVKKMSVAAADYHFDMDSKIFEEWFEKTLIPGHPTNSVIVIDNAPYHSRQATKIPCSSTKKSEILKGVYWIRGVFWPLFIRIQVS